MTTQVRTLFVRLAVIGLCLLWSSGYALAQESTPIQIGQNASGEVTAEAPTVRFSLNANAGETATIQVLGLTPGFPPRFRVLNPSAVEILSVPNPTRLSTVVGSASFAVAGTYTIEVEGADTTTGQFVLSV